MNVLAAAMVTVLATSGSTDTTLSVAQGARLEVSNYAGSVSVSTWTRDAVRVRADRDRRTRITLESEPTRLGIKSEGEYGPAGQVDFDITVPAWMPLNISGPFSDVDVTGTKSDVKVETVKGDVSVSGGSGYLDLSTVQGDLSVEGAKGRLKLNAVNEGITVARSTGQIEAESVNGDLVLDDVQLDAVDASTVSGDLWFNGTLKSGGRYQLKSHSGDIDVVVPEKPSVTVTVSTFSGEFASDFEVTFTGTRGHRELGFTLGSGASQLDLESFSGDVHLFKSSAVEAMRQEIRRRNHGEGMPAPPAPQKTPKPPKPAKPPAPPKDKSGNEED